MSKKIIFLLIMLTTIFSLSLTQIKLKMFHASSENLVGETIILRPLVQVLITGAVKTPGIYRLPKGAKIYQLTQLAGGLLPEAVVESNLLLSRVIDGTRIHISRKGDSKKRRIKSSSSLEATYNINEISYHQLSTLPGIGKKLARRIIGYRKIHGRFKSIKEIVKVEGIGKKRFNQIKPYFK